MPKNKRDPKKVYGRIFRKYFPDYEGMNPYDRPDPDLYGHADDAQIMDEALFEELKPHFSEYISYGGVLDDPCVIFTDLDETEFPEDIEPAKQYWVVLVSYHE